VQHKIPYRGGEKSSYLTTPFFIVKKFELKRYSDSFKGIASCLSSSVLGKPLVWGMPFSAGIELTNCCNLACPECASGSGAMKRQRGYMSASLFDKLIGESDSGLLHANLYFQGEPMMHPGFFSFVSKASHLRLTVSTNGHFLSGENANRLAASSLRRLIVSIDGMDRETYLIYRKGGDLEKVISGLREVSEAIRSAHSSIRLEIQFLVNRHNEAQIPAARKFAEDIGASFRLKSMQVLNPDNYEYWLPEDEKFRRYSISNGRYLIKSSLKNRCSRLWFSPVVTWDGLVVPCCFDKDANHVMGDMKINSLREIWYGEKYMDFRMSLLTERKSIAICRNCTTGLRER
jgi:MoaA/NifB/PqqE/SkfB family radical SAM enzyme